MEAALTQRAQCEGTSKKTGERCTAPTMNGGTLCAGHAGVGLADPSVAGKARHAKERARAEALQDRVDRAKLSLRDRLRLEMVDTQDELIRALYLEPLKERDRRHLLEVVNQAFGKPLERVETTEVAGKAIEELDDAGIKALEQRVLRLVDTPAPDPG